MQTETTEKKALAGIALAALGVVFGDIGTSPLYAMKEVFAGNHPIPLNEANILGSLSAFFWALIIVVSAEVRIDHHAGRQPWRGRHHGADRAGARDAKGQPAADAIITLIGILGAAMFYGDGMVTPAIRCCRRSRASRSSPRHSSIS